MKDAIIQKIKSLGNDVSFVELSKINGFSGDSWYGFPEKNIYLWFSCSDEAISALNELRAETEKARDILEGLL